MNKIILFIALIAFVASGYSRSGAVAYANKYVSNINHRCGSPLKCTPCAYFGSERCGYKGEGGDCANFVSQCLVKGGGHPNLSGRSDYCRGYPCGFEEPGAQKLSQCLRHKGWKSSCGRLMAPPSYIKPGDVLIYHKTSCTDFSAHAVIVMQGGSNARISCHSNIQDKVPYTYMTNMPYYEWLHYND